MREKTPAIFSKKLLLRSKAKTQSNLVINESKQLKRAYKEKWGRKWDGTKHQKSL